jgi:hypothetical protein
MGLDDAPSPSCGRRPLYGGELGVGVVKDDVDLKAPVERVALEGREAHVDLLSRCAPGVSTTAEIVVTSSLTSSER